jgi:hypothetical protein
MTLPSPSDLQAAASAQPGLSSPGTVYLVGAGPGDPELLTLKAHRLLRNCDALVHDSLVPKALLDLVPEHCETHFVGKRRGHHSVPQPSTNALLSELTARHRTVVRLKGGDPFLFGRGGEEAAHLARQGDDLAGRRCSERRVGARRPRCIVARSGPSHGAQGSVGATAGRGVLNTSRRPSSTRTS